MILQLVRETHGPYLLCFKRCDLRLPFTLNCLSQMLHWYGLSPVWILRCVCNFQFDVQILLQKWQINFNAGIWFPSVHEDSALVWWVSEGECPWDIVFGKVQMVLSTDKGGNSKELAEFPKAPVSEKIQVSC